MHCLYCGCFVLLFLLSPLIPCAQRLSDIGNAVLLLYPSFTLHLLTLAKITLLLMTSCDIQEMFGIIDSHCCQWGTWSNWTFQSIRCILGVLAHISFPKGRRSRGSFILPYLPLDPFSISITRSGSLMWKYQYIKANSMSV